MMHELGIGSLLPDRNPEETDSQYLNGCIEKGLPMEMLNSSSLQLFMTLKKGVRIPQGGSLLDVLQMDVRRPGEDSTDRLITQLQREIGERQTTLQMAMAIMDSKGASVVAEEGC